MTSPPLARALPVTNSRPVRRREAFFGLNFTSDFEAPEQNIGELLSRARPDYVQLWLKWHNGYLYYPGSLGPHFPGIVPDALPRWRELTREHGVALIAHYTGVWDERGVEAHPEWACVDSAGNAVPGIASTFSLYADEVMVPQLREVLTLYDLDGVWMDGDCWAARLDYSPAALAQWRAETGLDAAPKARGEAHWEQWKAFQRRELDRHMTRWTTSVRATHPQADLCCNWAYSLIMPVPIAAPLDWLSGDHSPTGSLDCERAQGRYFASSGLPWELHSWAFNSGAQFGIGDIEPTYKTATHLQQEAAVPIMLGGGITLGSQFLGSGYVPEPAIDVLAEVGEFCRARQEISHGSRSVPQVALVYSSAAWAEQTDNVVSGAWGPFGELDGALHALLELHYSIDILSEHLLEPRLAEFPLVVLPDPPVLREGFDHALLEYVRGGGKLLLLGERCARPFEPALGVRFVGPPQPLEAVLEARNGLNAQVSGPWQQVEPTTATVLMSRYATRDTRQPGTPAATLVSYGRGEIAAVYGPVAKRYQHTHHPALRQFVGAVVEPLFPDPAVSLAGPPCIDVSLRRTRAGELSLHLLNLAGAQRGQDFLNTDFIPPVGPLKVSMRLPNRPGRVLWEPDNVPLKWTWKAGG